MATVTQPPVKRSPVRVKRTKEPAEQFVEKPVKEQLELNATKPDEDSRRDRWISIVILVAILTLMGLLLFLAGLQTPSSPAPPHWTDWPMM